MYTSSATKTDQRFLKQSNKYMKRYSHKGWPPFGHESIEHKPLTALEQWKTFRHRSLWLVMSNWSVSKRAPPSHKTCRDRHDFFLPLPSEIPHSGTCHRSLTRHFVGPTPAIFTIPMLLPLRSISPPTATGQPIRTPGSYGAANENALFNNLITPSTNQSSIFTSGPRLSGASGRMEGVCFDAP